MKAVLISIQPKWCEKIANGKKTIEVRKSRPKLETPFKCYIYCTKSKKHFLQSKDNMFFYCEESDFIGKHGAGLYQRLNGKVIGEFVCNRIDEYGAEFTELQYPDACDKNVSLNSIKRVEFDEEADEPFYRYETSNEEYNPDDCKFLKESCLTFNEVRQYIGETCYDKHFYGWHISQLKIYDKPKELSEFEFPKDNIYLSYRKRNQYFKGITRPPQSWCYVEELQNG